MILFHGGCHGCTQQETKGIDFCSGCCYLEPDWSKPSLNNRKPSLADEVRYETIAKCMSIGKAHKWWKKHYPLYPAPTIRVDAIEVSNDSSNRRCSRESHRTTQSTA